MPRKIAQITCGGERLVALCGDGTLWTLDLIDMSRPIKWEKLPSIPDKNKNDKDEG